jgi:glycosyltransferase involved in cell wall biosynthesis
LPVVQGRPLLTIVIPTRNRGERLSQALHDLERHLKSSRGREQVEVVVCDNHSGDSTRDVVTAWLTRVTDEGVHARYFRRHQSGPLSANLDLGMQKAAAKHLWFLSDDDNLAEGAIDTVLRTTSESQADVCVFNFDQPPFSRDHPLIQEAKHFSGEQAAQGLSVLIAWPKLSSIVVATHRDPRLAEVLRSAVLRSPWFPHVAAAMTLVRAGGAVQHDPAFIAYPDRDFLSKVDFPPTVSFHLRREVVSLLNEQNWTGNARSDVLDSLPQEDLIRVSIDFLFGQRFLRRQASREVVQEAISIMNSEMRDRSLTPGRIVLSDLRRPRALFKSLVWFYGTYAGVRQSLTFQSRKPYR